MEYYEPMLYICTPEYPNTMGMIAVLKEPVDGKILREVVEELRQRFPYYYVQEKQEGTELITAVNPRPMTVREGWGPINLCSEEANYHLAAFKYDGRRLCFEVLHSITDGAGALPYMKSVLYLYLSRKSGHTFDPSGFRLPGEEIPESEIGDPFAGIDIDGADAPVYQPETVADFYRLSDGTDTQRHIFYVKLPEEQVIRYCKDNDGSPNILLSVLLAKAIRRYDPESDKTVSVSVAVNHKAVLGNHDNYRMFANVAELSFKKDRDLSDLSKACTGARGQLILQTQPENSIRVLKTRKAICEKLSQAPLEIKFGMVAKAAATPRWSVSVSYADNRSFGPLDPYIDEFYMLASPGTTDVICEVACLNHSFFLSFIQVFSSDKFFRIFLEELADAGIPFEVTGSDSFQFCGIERG